MFFTLIVQAGDWSYTWPVPLNKIDDKQDECLLFLWGNYLGFVRNPRVDACLLTPISVIERILFPEFSCDLFLEWLGSEICLLHGN